MFKALYLLARRRGVGVPPVQGVPSTRSGGGGVRCGSPNTARSRHICPQTCIRKYFTPSLSGQILIYCFASAHAYRLFRGVGKGVGVSKIGLGHFEDTHSPVVLCALGGLCISTIAIVVAPTIFWSEFEIDTIAQPGKELPYIWPPVMTARIGLYSSLSLLRSLLLYKGCVREHLPACNERDSMRGCRVVAIANNADAHNVKELPPQNFQVVLIDR